MSESALSYEERRDLQELLREVEEDAVAVLLVGSRARGTSDDWSDIDILVVGSGHMPRVRGRVQVLQASEEELTERLQRGDDFVSWVIRFGKPIHGRKRWQQLKSRLSARDRWPDAGLKRRKAEAHFERARALAEMGDEEAAKEEASLALSHLARAVLLESHVFPLSRPELSRQLEEVSEHQLAGAFASSEHSTNQLLHLLEGRLSSS